MLIAQERLLRLREQRCCGGVFYEGCWAPCSSVGWWRWVCRMPKRRADTTPVQSHARTLSAVAAAVTAEPCVLCQRSARHKCAMLIEGDARH